MYIIKKYLRIIIYKYRFVCEKKCRLNIWIIVHKAYKNRNNITKQQKKICLIRKKLMLWQHGDVKIGKNILSFYKAP